MSREIRIGVNIGKIGSGDRGISVYTQQVLRQIGLQDNIDLTLLHYPVSEQPPSLDAPSAKSKTIPFSDKNGPVRTIFNEQVIAPLAQSGLGLDVIWHPHNRCQFFSPGVKYVATLHDVLPLARPDLSTGYLINKAKILLYLSRTMSARYADRIITDSIFSKDEITRLLGVDPKNIDVIHLGVDKGIYNPQRDYARESSTRSRYNLPDKYMVTTGSYAPHKNLVNLVEAYRQSNLPKKNIGLVIAGPNNASGYRVGFDNVTDFVNRHGLADQVLLLPSIPTTDQVDLYRGAQLFATTSLYEGFGLTPVEAMACGTPVVVSNTSAIPEICGDAALYADPNDPKSFSNQFDLLLEDQAIRSEMISRGTRQSMLYNWQVTAGNVVTTIKSTVYDKL